VRLYYTDDMTCDDQNLTISLSFPFEEALVLKFKGAQAACRLGAIAIPGQCRHAPHLREAAAAAHGGC
jgi:hypothetical protein